MRADRRRSTAAWGRPGRVPGAPASAAAVGAEGVAIQPVPVVNAACDLFRYAVDVNI